MKQKMKIQIKIWSGAFIVLGLAMTRLLPHPDNFTPIIATALFGGAYFSNIRLAFLIPLLAMVLSDIALEFFLPNQGFHNLMIVVYGCFVGFVGLGFVLRKYNAFYAPAIMAVIASTLFFIITNFAVWVISGLYPHTIEGLIACFFAALPFYGNSLAGDLFWTISVFGIWHLAAKNFHEFISAD